jgi:hypothetical protein
MDARFPGRRRFLRIAIAAAAMYAYSAPVVADPDPQDSSAFPFISAAYTVLPASDIESAPAGTTLETKENQLVVGFTVFKLGQLDLDIGFDYQYTRYGYENVDSRNRDLHRLQFPIGFGHNADGWSVAGYLAPGVATSSNVLKNIGEWSSDDLLVTGQFEVSMPRNEQFSWLWGAAYDRSFGDEKPYPVLGLSWQPRDSLALRLAFPNPAIVYQPRDRHRLALALFPAGFEWHVVTDDFNDEYTHQVEALRLQGVWSYRFARSAWLDLSLGYEFDRRHRFEDAAGQVIDAPIDSQVVLMIGLRWGDGPIPLSHAIAGKFLPNL